MAADGSRGRALLRRLPDTGAYTEEELETALRIAEEALLASEKAEAERSDAHRPLKVAIAQLHTRLGKHCRQPVVRREALAQKLRLTTRWRYDDYEIAWFAGVKDVPQSFFERKIALFPHRIATRLPRAREALCKSNFARLLEAFYRVVPPSCIRRSPRSWVGRLPTGPASPFYISKPDMARGGSGIRVWQASDLTDPALVHRQIVQEYVDRPMLLDGYKFDLRVYVLVTSTLPLRAHLYEEGLVRVCTELYEPPTPQNIDNACMHLTNYAVNKTSAKFRGAVSGGYNPEEDLAEASGYDLNFDTAAGDAEGAGAAGAEMHETEDDGGTKQTLTRWLGRMRKKGHDTQKIMAEIRHCLAHSLVAMEGMLASNTSIVLGDDITAMDGAERCCHLLGCDIMFDADGKAWMLEVNTNPSLLCGTAVDWDIKEPLAESLVRWLSTRSSAMLTYLSKHDDEVVEQARAANAKLPKMASGRDTTVHLFTGSNGANRPKHSVGVGRMGSARPAVPAYQRITPPPMDAALAGTTSPMYFETLGPLLERYQAMTPFRGDLFVTAFRRFSVQARPKAMREARSLAVVPVELLFSTVTSQWEALCQALESSAPAPATIAELWPGEAQWLSAPVFADSVLMLARYLLKLPLSAVLEATREEMPQADAAEDAAGDAEQAGAGLTLVGRTIEKVLLWLKDVDNSDFEQLHARVVAEQGEDLPESIGDEALLS